MYLLRRQYLYECDLMNEWMNEWMTTFYRLHAGIYLKRTGSASRREWSRGRCEQTPVVPGSTTRRPAAGRSCGPGRAAPQCACTTPGEDGSMWSTIHGLTAKTHGFIWALPCLAASLNNSKGKKDAVKSAASQYTTQKHTGSV